MSKKKKNKKKQKNKSFFRSFFEKIIAFIIIVPLIGIIGLFSIAYIYKLDLYRNNTLKNKIESTMNKSTYVDSENVSPCFLEAVTSIEDHRFYEHKGFDLISFTRAMVSNLKSGTHSQGGSTITQQLAKNLYLSSFKSYFRKAVELLIAIDIENSYDKATILELYVNVIYYGKNSYGILNASRTFLNKDPIYLTHDESAYLAGLTQSPTLYSTNKELGEKRKQLVLNAMNLYSNCIHNKDNKVSE